MLVTSLEMGGQSLVVRTYILMNVRLFTKLNIVYKIPTVQLHQINFIDGWLTYFSKQSTEDVKDVGVVRQKQ